jgi:hypothetical protein
MQGKLATLGEGMDVEEVRNVPGNAVCADCEALGMLPINLPIWLVRVLLVNVPASSLLTPALTGICNVADPIWAVINRGTLICKNCAGVHRNLGVHVSKVRSLTLDDWAPSFLAIMRSVGNELANAVWEVRRLLVTVIS